MGFINDLVNGQSPFSSYNSDQSLDDWRSAGPGVFGFSQPPPLSVTPNQAPSTYVDPYVMPFMPGLGQYTRDPRDAYNKRGNEFPGSQFAPQPADAVHAPYIPDPPKPVWTPWHQAIATGGWGAGPLGAGMGIPGAPDGTPFMTKTWTQPQTPRPPAAPAPIPAPAATTQPAYPDPYGAASGNNGRDPRDAYNKRGNEFPGSAAAASPLPVWNSAPVAQGSANTNTAWSGGSSPSWRR